VFNAAAEKMFACPAQEAIGAHIERFIPQRFQVAHEGHIRRFGDIGSTSRSMGTLGALSGVRTTGEEFPIEASISHTEADGKKVFTVIIRDVTERRLSEDTLKRSEERSKEQVLHAPVAMVVTRGGTNEIEVLNFKFTQLFGYSIEDVPDEAHWWPLAYPDESYREAIKTEWQKRVEKAVKSDIEIEPMEATVRCKDGSTRHIEFHFASLGDTGLVSFVDLTDRHRAEEALRESEERFRLVANAAPVLIWMSGPDKLCTYFNQPWLRFTGRSIHEELGNRWAEGVHPEDLERCIDTYTKAFERREPFEMEYRLRRHDGEYRWILDLGVPRFNGDGSFAGYIGSCHDVTQRKMAEEALSGVSRRLIEAHEEERTWIARELHDDINQRVALLTVNMTRLGQELPASTDGLRNRLQDEIKQLSDIGSEIQALSHRLHSSKLEYLGLTAAAASFCRELSDQQKVEIDFHSDDIPKQLPQEIALCLFRVLQEAAQNAAKYSGSKQFQVTLSSTSNEIHLTVRDSGIGFDLEQVLKGRGLGLTSMRERLKLVDGELSIDTKVQHGTTIRAVVSLHRSSKSARASG
jgi:PAS domain S-box-containing protein